MSEETRRPLTGYEQFFHDDPRRPVSEGKLIFTGARFIHRLLPCPAVDVEGVAAATREAWLHTCRTWRYLRHVIEDSPDADGDPILVERGMSHVVAQLHQTVRVFDATALVPPSTWGSGGDAESSEQELMDLAIEAEQKRDRFDVSKSLGWVVVGLRGRQEESLPCADLSVGLFTAHSGSDGRSALAMFSTFLLGLDAALGGKAMPPPLPETLAAASIIPPGELAVPLMKVVRSPLVLPHATPDELVVPLIPPLAPLEVGRCEINIVRDSLSVEETQQLISHARQAGVSVQSVLSVASAIAVMAGAPSPAREAFLRQEGLLPPPSSDEPTRVAKIGCFVPVQLRDMCDPPLPPSTAVVGGSAVWVYGKLTSGVTLLGLARHVKDELYRQLQENEAFGFLKMYLKPPGSSEPHYVRLGNSARAASSIRHLVTIGLSNIGLNACTSLHEQLSRETTVTDPVLGIVNFARTTPPAEFIRGQAFTFNNQLTICYSFTKPSYSREAVKALLHDTLVVVRALLLAMTGAAPDPKLVDLLQQLMR